MRTCLLCADTRWVSIYEPDPDEDWVSHLVGAGPLSELLGQLELAQ